MAIKTTHIFHDGKWIDRRELQVRGHSAPYIITDEIAPLEHPATGEILTSKKKFRDSTKAAGCYELGTDRVERRGITIDERGIEAAVCEAYERADSRG